MQNINNKFLSIVSCTLLVSISNLIANDNFDDLMSELKNTTKIATKNKVNVNYAPGIITILKSDDLKRRGVKNFFDALKFIPSVNIDISSIGTHNIITRGIGGIIGSGKTKIMINGVGQNIDASGLFHINLPIEIIERKEVIRGPASALYGEYAFNGVVNIITKKANSVFTQKTTNDYMIGTNLFYSKNDLSINANISYVNDSGINPTTTMADNTIKKIGTSRENQNVIASIKYKNFKANIAINKAKKGEFYGLLSTAPNDDKTKHFIYDYKNIEIANKFIVNDQFTIEPKIGYFNYNYWFSSTVPTTTADTKYNKQYYMLDSFYNLKNNQIISGVEYAKTYEKGDASNNRKLSSIYIQDNIKLTSKLTTNFGVRYDKYNDKSNKKLTNSVLPRIAAVYNYDDINIYKLQYAKAYRPPTFLEDKLTTISPENIYTYELQHIYNKADCQIQTTLFYSIIQDLIIDSAHTRNGTIYTNKSDDIISKGVEFEYKLDYKDFLFNYNASYADAYEKNTKTRLKNYSKILSNLSISYLPYAKFTSTINGRYIGSKKRDISDTTREDLESKYIFDLVFKYLPKNNIDIVFGIRNMFNTDIYSISNTPKVFPAATIKDDFLQSRRESFVKVVYKF